MQLGMIVENSTFPSAMALKGHEAWYYWSPGSSGTRHYWDLMLRTLNLW